MHLSKDPKEQQPNFLSCRYQNMKMLENVQ